MKNVKIPNSIHDKTFNFYSKSNQIIPTLSRIQIHAHWSQLIFPSLLRSLKYVCFYMSSTEFLAIIYPFWPCRHLCCMSINIWSKIERNTVLMEFYCLQSDFWKKSNTRAKHCFAAETKTWKKEENFSAPNIYIYFDFGTKKLLELSNTCKWCLDCCNRSCYYFN